MSESHKPTLFSYAVFCGLDVGKGVTPRLRPGPRRDKALRPSAAQRRGRLRCVLSELSRHGRILVIVDQPASNGALAIAVTGSLGIDVDNLPDLAMRRIADRHPKEGKTDRDAYVIADAALTMPHTLRRTGADEDTLAGLAVLAGYGDDLAAQATRVSNRLRDALLHVHPPCNAYWVSTLTTRRAGPVCPSTNPNFATCPERGGHR